MRKPFIYFLSLPIAENCQMIALPSPLQFDHGQTQLVIAFQCHWWLVLLVHVVKISRFLSPDRTFWNNRFKARYFTESSTNDFLIFLVGSASLLFILNSENKIIRMRVTSVLCLCIITTGLHSYGLFLACRDNDLHD